jgi:hypothetical protein
MKSNKNSITIFVISVFLLYAGPRHNRQRLSRLYPLPRAGALRDQHQRLHDTHMQPKGGGGIHLKLTKCMESRNLSETGCLNCQHFSQL